MPPVVALESTLVAHGLPYPQNLEVALELEAEIRSVGAVPKTIAILDGKPKIGVDRGELERIARAGHTLAKAGAADLAVALGRRGDAATTVSGTIWLAAREGIRVMATGGIGGVHRGDPSDVSLDLATMARLPIAVVSAGAKAILDLPRTLEMLETYGVLVVGYRTSEFPAFYSRSSGLRLEHRADSVTELASIVEARRWLGQAGTLIANPIPAEAEIPSAEILPHIEAAVRNAVHNGTYGKALTPTLLAELAHVTGGRSVAANRALARANARLAAELAVALG
jgi:pseudouridylate synthase